MYNKKDSIAYKERESYVHRDGRRVERYVGNLGLFGSLDKHTIVYEGALLIYQFP